MIDVLIVYLAGLFVFPALPAGPVRRAAELLYAPCVALGLWYRWSMYAPDAPRATQVGVVGVVLDDGSFVPVLDPGFDDGVRLGQARSLRHVAFQWALCDPVTDYVKAALGERALQQWRARGGAEPRAVEVRQFLHRSPVVPGALAAAGPDITVLWTCPVAPPEEAS